MLWMCDVHNNIEFIFIRPVIIRQFIILASDENISFTAGRTVIVTKWADYTGKIGFGCVLNDGTLCVLFTDGSSLGHRLITLY